MDHDGDIDVSQFVRFETQFGDIDHGVLDVVVSFWHEGQLAHMYLLHYFALTERHDKKAVYTRVGRIYVRLSPCSAQTGCDLSGAHDKAVPATMPSR